MTQATVVLRRNEDDYVTVTVEGDVSLTSADVEFDNVTYRDAFAEFPGVFPLTERELAQLEHALEEEAVEEAQDRIDERREAFWDCRPYALEVSP